MRSQQQQLDLVQDLANEAMHIKKRLERFRDRVGKAHYLNGLGLVAIDAGRSDEAEELLKTAVAVGEETRSTQARGISPQRGSHLPGSRRLGPARDIFAENLSFARANHDDLDVAMSSHRWKPLVVTARAGRIPAVFLQPLLVRRARAGKDFARSRSDFGDTVIIARLAAELRCYS